MGEQRQKRCAIVQSHQRQDYLRIRSLRPRQDELLLKGRKRGRRNPQSWLSSKGSARGPLSPSDDRRANIAIRTRIGKSPVQNLSSPFFVKSFLTAVPIFFLRLVRSLICKAFSNDAL